MTQDDLKVVLTYDPDTGVFNRIKAQRGIYAGSVAGGINKANGYRYIAIDNKKFLAHRLAWLYVYGEFPEHEIDHINGDRSDNRIENLRQATRKQNAANRKIHSSSTTGFKGVKRSGNKWEAQIGVNRKKIYLGTYSTPEEAHSAYVEAAKKHYGEFHNGSK